MAKAKNGINEKALSKGEVRKLNALRKSLGVEIAEEAFTKWMAQQANGNGATDPNIEIIEDALSPLMDRVRIPRGAAYAVRRGRGRFIVEAVNLRA